MSNRESVKTAELGDDICKRLCSVEGKEVRFKDQNKLSESVYSWDIEEMANAFPHCVRSYDVVTKLVVRDGDRWVHGDVEVPEEEVEHQGNSQFGILRVKEKIDDPYFNDKNIVHLLWCVCQHQQMDIVKLQEEVAALSSASSSEVVSASVVSKD